MALGKQKKEIGDIQRAVNPHLNRLQRAGITPNVAIQRSLAWDAHIQKNPAQGIRDMAKAYGVDLGAVQQETADENRYLTPTERALQAENQALTGKVEQIEKGMAQWNQRQQQSAWSRRQANAQAMLDEFMNATDSSGNRLHPYIEHCAPMMSKLIDAGLAENLEDAYQKAAALTPEVAQAREKTRKAREAQAARDQVKKARKASSGIVSGGRTKGGKPTKKGKTFEQRASENYDRIANA